MDTFYLLYSDVGIGTAMIPLLILSCTTYRLLVMSDLVGNELIRSNNLVESEKCVKLLSKNGSMEK